MSLISPVSLRFRHRLRGSYDLLYALCAQGCAQGRGPLLVPPLRSQGCRAVSLALGCAACPHPLLNTLCFGCCSIPNQTCLAMFISKPLELYCQGLLCFWYLGGSISPVSLCLRGLTAKLILLLSYPTPQSPCRGGTEGNHRQDTHPEGKLAGLQAGEKHSRASILAWHLPLLKRC